MKQRRIKPVIFKKAAKLIKDNLRTNAGPNTCCDALYETWEPYFGRHTSEYFQDSPEYLLFKKMFSRKRGGGKLWFGSPTKWNKYFDYPQPNPTNQVKRIDALMKAYKKARRINAKAKS